MTQVPFTLRARNPDVLECIASRVEDDHCTERKKTMEVA